ncbi:MAG: hypothetical protein HOV81_22530 [Kofleriaceae bacterium]|nr:hypothetical protein [Kofleriaceae bacterium]
MDFSSWPRDQEQSFVVYEQRSAESSKKALMGGIIAGVAFFVIALGVYAGVEPDKRDITKGMNMDNLTKKAKKADAAPTPAPAAAPAAEAPKAEAAPAAAPAEENK